MAVTGNFYNTLEFGNVNSGDYGVYITGTGVYNAPARAVEMVSVPGRNGDVPIDMGHWDNIEVTYKCGLFGIDQSEMGSALMEFRNAIASQIGYQRLSDSYNPNEFRLGLFMAGLEFDAVSMSRAGEFELKFNCKPQRFLTDGEDMIDVENDWSDLKTASGEVVTFEVEDDAAANYTQFKSLVADIDPIQDLSHGAPSPENICPISGWDSAEVVVSPTTSEEDGTTHTATFDETVYGGTVDLVSGVLTVDRAYIDLGSLDWRYRSEVKAGLFSNVSFSDYKHSTDLRCICENYDYKGTVENVAWMTSKQNGQLCFYSSSVYPNNSGLYIIDNRFTSKDDFKTAVTGVKLVYELATPLTIQLDPQTITTLVGVNNVWANSGDVSVEYGVRPGVLVNPTQYESSPLLDIEGSGAITIDDYSIVIENNPIGKVELSNGVSVSDQKIAEWSEVLTLDLSPNINLLLDGDTFKLSGLSFMATYNAGYSGTAGTMSVITVPTNGAITLSSSGPGRYVSSVKLNEMQFVKGSASSFSDSWVLSRSFNGKTGTYTFGVVVSYDGNSTLTVTKTFTQTGINIGWLTPNNSIISSVIGNSSKQTLSGQVIIDSETGDAYRIEDGTYISLNKYIQLGAQLPTLRPGANIITYDDTIESLKIAPRWWRL